MRLLSLISQQKYKNKFHTLIIINDLADNWQKAKILTHNWHLQSPPPPPLHPDPFELCIQELLPTEFFQFYSLSR